ncbi:hypothetical protein [Chloracidobacterium aggregatum]|jgi:hypothetical protein|uniref:Peptidase C-terminal archaeal/bacterial domain-containing protein n=1 Tax=Chloracidobacterium sp. N TaxID=2821540 RepID=A0ABX8B1Z8_9BACT|nr:hypothetical protein [Chloracidobacterium aggregatum]QUV84121.1 hypothetical protein J8C03_08195 [Chloracidobacterium sp. 2]QUV87394.1 hypothetical protein J8C07_09450 [Chloracidobacterium sp. S]QUV90297.1 hypothetical protein J8C04_08450 [Chloracidobacterium sp. A]QUV93509.1 hypothetical protein J8C05_09030 [Chloracidobacterium sp. N]QUV96665.1 hypothetical protein J8C00_10175 [Chloracidobacterium sp. E]
MLCRFSRRQLIAGVVASLATAVSPVLGQTRRATRIRFTPGASSSTVMGVLPPRTTWRKYVLRANAGQTLTFAVSRTNPQLGVSVYDEIDGKEEPSGEPLTGVAPPTRTGEVTLPVTGDYFLYVWPIKPVKLTTPIKYSLTVEIR